MSKNKAVEELKREVGILQHAVRELKASGINEDILLIAIQKSAKRFYTGSPIRVKHIKWILKGLENLDEYLFLEEPE